MIRAAWTRFWFAGEDPRNLAAARIIVSLQALWILLSRDIARLSETPELFWYLPRQELARRFLLVPGVFPVERAVELCAMAALVLVALGLHVPLTATVAAIALYHLAPLQTVLATVDPINRGLTIATLGLVVLAASPCADRWSVGNAPPSAAEAWEYGWPLRLLWLFVAEVYLFGAVGKLRVSGLAWFTAENLRRNLVLYLHMHPAVVDPLTSAMAAQPLLLQAAAFGVLVLEGGFIAALFSVRARRPLVAAALAFHLMILRTMRIVFANVVYLGLFVNWAWLADRLRQARRAAPPASPPAPAPSSR